MAARTRQGGRTVTKSPATMWRELERQQEAEKLELAFWRWCLGMNGAGLLAGLPRCKWNGGQLVFGGISGRRRWAFDFAFTDHALAVELDGGTWKGGQGGHTSGRGYDSDRRKDAEALIGGWRVLRLTSGMLADGCAFAYVERLLGIQREAASAALRRAA